MTPVEKERILETLRRLKSQTEFAIEYVVSTDLAPMTVDDEFLADGIFCVGDFTISDRTKMPS